MINDNEYTHYVIANDGTSDPPLVDGWYILTGWHYREDAKESLTDTVNIVKRQKVIAKRTLSRYGLDADNDRHWHAPAGYGVSNDG